MFLTGDIYEERSQWWASVEMLGAHAAAASRLAAHKALAATILEIAGDYGPVDGWTLDITDDGENTLLVSSSDPARLTSLLIRHQRDRLAFSLAEVTKATGAKSRNGWAQYEQGIHEPSPSKLQRMLDAVDSGLIVAVIPRTARVLPREDQTGMEEMLRAIEDPSPANIAAMRAKLTKRVVYTSGKRKAKPAARTKRRARRGK